MIPINSHVVQDFLTKSPRFLGSRDAKDILKRKTEPSEYGDDSRKIGV